MSAFTDFTKQSREKNGYRSSVDTPDAYSPGYDKVKCSRHSCRRSDTLTFTEANHLNVVFIKCSECGNIVKRSLVVFRKTVGEPIGFTKAKTTCNRCRGSDVYEIKKDKTHQYRVACADCGQESVWPAGPYLRGKYSK